VPDETEPTVPRPRSRVIIQGEFYARKPETAEPVVSWETVGGTAASMGEGHAYGAGAPWPDEEPPPGEEDDEREVPEWELEEAEIARQAYADAGQIRPGFPLGEQQHDSATCERGGSPEVRPEHRSTSPAASCPFPRCGEPELHQGHSIADWAAALSAALNSLSAARGAVAELREALAERDGELAALRGAGA